MSQTKKHWLVISILSLLAAISIGLCTNAVGVFYDPVAKDLGVLKGSFAMHATLSSLANALTSLMMAKIIKRVNYRKLLWVSLTVATITTLAMAFSDQLWEFYVLGIARGIAIGTFGMVPLTMIITNWFEKKHGLATSITLSFSGLSGAIFSPLLSYFISTFGWREAYMFAALSIVLLGIPALCVHWTITPEAMGLMAYGAQNNKQIQEPRKNKVPLVSVSLICLGIFTVLHTSITGISQHMSGMATSIQLSAALGATMMSAAMLGNIACKLFIGVLSDALGPIKACVCMIFINILSLLGLAFGMFEKSAVLLLISSFTFGSIYAVGAVGIPLLTRYFFGQENFGSVYSVIAFLTNVGSSLSLTLIGYFYDFMGTYITVLWIAIGFHLFDLIMMMIVYRSSKLTKIKTN